MMMGHVLFDFFELGHGERVAENAGLGNRENGLATLALTGRALRTALSREAGEG